MSIDDRVLAQQLQLTVHGQEKIGIIGPNGIGKSTLLAKVQRILNDKERFPLVLCTRLPQKLQLDLSPIAYLSKTGRKRGTTENPISLSKSQFQLSRNAASNSLLIWRTTGKTSAFGFSLAQTKLSPAR